MTRRRPFVHDVEPPPALSPEDRVGRAEFARLPRRLLAEAAAGDPGLAEALRRRGTRPWRGQGRRSVRTGREPSRDGLTRL